MATHSALGPSTLERRALCPGSYREERRSEDQTTTYAADGHVAHQLMAQYVGLELTQQQVLDAAPDGLVDGLWGCMQYVDRLRERHPSARLYAERQLDCSGIHPAIGHGTADLVIVWPFQRVAIIDWKFGWQDVEPAKANKQLAAYALAALDEFDSYEPPHVRVVLGAHGRISGHVISEQQQIAWRERLRQIAEACLSPAAPCRPSSGACRFCSACATCPAMIGAAVDHEDTDGNELTNNEIARLLERAEMLDRWCGAVKQQAYQRAMAGADLPGYVLAPGRNYRKWADGVAPERLREIAAELQKDPDAVLETKLASVAKLEKAWGKAKPVREALAALIVNEEGKPRLVRQTD